MELPAQLELDPAWREIRAQLRRAIDDSTFEIWLEPLTARAWDGAVLLLEAPPETQAWVADRFGRLLERATRAVYGAAARIAFTPAPLDTADTAASGAGPGAGSTPLRGTFLAPALRTSGRGGRAGSQPPPIPEPTDRFNPRYSFEQYVMGDGNRLAHAAALAVAENPGHAYNPLFLHGPPGLGKTHLLHAIGNYINAFGGGAAVRYTTVETFTNGFVAALGSKGLDRFKHLHRDVDVLLIDDVQFLARKTKTEEEFFHTFNAIYDAGSQVVLTCDRLPSQLIALEERLRDRFQSGLVADLAPPDHGTRVAILRKRVALDRIELADPAVLDLVAHRVTDNIRSLEGVLIKLVAKHSLTGRPIDLDLTRAVLDDIHPLRNQPGPITVEQIQQVVATHFDLTPDELVSQSRAAKLAWARQLAMHLARELTHESLQAIGTAFGGRNHATVLHACQRVSDKVVANPDAAADLAALHAMLGDDQRGDRAC